MSRDHDVSQTEIVAKQQSFERQAVKTAPTRDAPTQPDSEAESNEASIEGVDPIAAGTDKASQRPTLNRVTVLEPPPPSPDNFNTWLLVAAVAVAAVVAVLFLISTEEIDTLMPAKDYVRQPAAASEQRPVSHPDSVEESELPESVKKQLAEAEKIREEVERLKQIELEHQRALEQAENLQRERDAALVKARVEQDRRVREAERTKRAIEREQAAAKALLAEKAALAESEAKALAESEAKALAEKRRLADQERKQRQKLEQEARELRKMRLEQEAREQEQAQAQRLARERQQQQAEREQSVDTEQTRIQQERMKRNAGFSADPCAGPSAKFLSSCRK